MLTDIQLSPWWRYHQAVKDTTPAAAAENHTADPQGSPAEHRSLETAILQWSGALAAAALIAVPLLMLIGNPAVLGGHPALPVLLAAAVAVGLVWSIVLVRRTGLVMHRALATLLRRSCGASKWHLFRGLVGRLDVHLRLKR